MKAHKRTSTFWLGRSDEYKDSYARMDKLAEKWAKKEAVRMKV